MKKHPYDPSGLSLSRLFRRCAATLAILALGTGIAEAQGIRYRELFGRNYGILPSAGVIRHSPNNGYKWDADVTGLTTSPAYQVTGGYSGQIRYHDFTGVVGGKDLYAAQDILYDAWMRNFATMNPNGTYADTLEFVSNDSKYAKDLWHHMFTVFNTGAYAGHPQLAWQLGNEINNPFQSNSVPFDTATIGQWQYFNSPEQLAGYVEHLFGPVVEAIEDASYATYGDYNKADIILGSVANAYNEASITWQRDLLDSTITDSARCPRIAGTQVWEHTDYLSIHYRMSGNTALSSLYTSIAGLYNDYVATGKIKGIYATEENGNSGQGAPTIVKVFSRWMYFWQSDGRTWSPEKGAVTFWGDATSKPGGTGTLGEEILWKLLGERPASLQASVFDAVRTVTADNTAITDPEYYHFNCDAKTAMIMYHDNSASSKSLSYLDIANLDGAADLANPLIALRFSNDTLPSVLAVTRSTAGSAHRVTFAPTQTLGDGDDIIVLFFGHQAMPLPNSLGGIPPLVDITDANLEDRTAPFGDAGTDVIGVTAATNNVGFTGTSEMRNEIKFAIDRVDSNLLNTAAYLTLRVDSVTNASSIGGLTIDNISLNDYIYASPEDFGAIVVTSQAGIPAGSTATGIVQIDITSMLNSAYNTGVDYLKLCLRPGSTWGAGSGDRFYTLQQGDAATNGAPYITGVGPASNFAATPGANQIALTWTNPAQPPFAGGQIQRSTGGHPQYPEDGTTVYTGTGTSYTDTGLTSGTTYYYSLFPYDNAGLFASAVVLSAAPTTSPPAAPTGLSATAGNAQVSLMWTASSGATSYNVKRATTSGGPYTTIASPSAPSYTDTTVTNGTTYYYVVSAVNAGGESANSTQASATPQVPPPAVPTGLSATAGNAQVSLMWTASSGATSYNVKRATTSGGPYTTIASPTTPTYTDTTVTNGTTYYYVVSAVNAGGESANSTQASATPQAPQTTVTFTSIAADDGRIQELSETSETGGTLNSSDNTTSSLRIGDNDQDRQLKAFVSFDTSSIPDGATIVSATLKLMRGNLTGTNPFTTHGTCLVDASNGGFNGNAALELADFQVAATATNIVTTGMSNPTANGVQSTGALNSTGLSAINKTGKTQFRVYLSLGDNDDLGNDAIGFYSGEATQANRPVLEIVYQ